MVFQHCSTLAAIFLSLNIIKASNLPNDQQPFQFSISPFHKQKEPKTHRQQPLHNLAHTAQPQRAHRKRKLQQLAPRCLQDPVERERDQEEGHEVQHFVRLLVRGDLVIGRREAGGGGEEEEPEEGA
jgi:hypothetical protein